MMKKLFLIACLLSTFAFSINAQNSSPAPRLNLVKANISYGGAYGAGLGIGYERLLGKRHYVGINGYSNFNYTYESSLSYKYKFMRIGRLSLLGGVNLSYSDIDYSHLDAESGKGTLFSFNPLLELRLKVTRKVDVTAIHNWKSTTLSHTGQEFKALNQGWGIGVNVKF